MYITAEHPRDLSSTSLVGAIVHSYWEDQYAGNGKREKKLEWSIVGIKIDNKAPSPLTTMASNMS